MNAARVCSWVLAASLPLSCASTTSNVEAVTHPNPEPRIILWARSALGGTQADGATLRELVAARRGATELPGGLFGRTQFTLRIGRVMQGAYEDKFVDVIVLGEAAHAVPEERDDHSDLDAFTGRWTLTRVDGRTFVVEDIENTPFPVGAVAHRDALRAKIAEGLASDDPTFRALALASLREHRMLEFVPQVAALLGSHAQPTKRPWLAQFDETIETLARRTLVHLIDGLADDNTPTFHDPPEDWQRWWDETMGAAT